MATILIADDSKYLRTQIKTILQDLGHEVIGEAENGEEALEKYFALKPDIVTLDVIMPKKHGIDTLKEIMESNPDAKVVIVSAVTHEPLIKKGLAMGALNFITKPFTPAEFISGFSMVG